MGIILLVSTASPIPVRAAYNYNDADRQARWSDLRKLIFGDRTPRTDDEAVQLDAPNTALEAALVPIAITTKDPTDVKALYVVIDDNPSPLAAHFVFGPDADPARIRMRVRVNHLTAIHAVVEKRDGTLIETAHLVKASGGCSAPMGMSDEEAMRGMGEMRLKLDGGAMAVGKSVEATLMIRHPNFNGMQMNEALQVFTPARYIQTIGVTFAGRSVFTLETDISLASNPVISFGMLPHASQGDLDVRVSDSRGGSWSKSFALPMVGN